MAESQKGRKPGKTNRYARIIEAVFFKHYKNGADEVVFSRDEIPEIANQLGIKLPKNLGDIMYTFRYRMDLPKSIVSKATLERSWIIRPAGRALYKFVQVNEINIQPNLHLIQTKIPDSTPGVVSLYSFHDEQALLAKIRYNRLIDIFTGITCYSLQNHLRTTVPDLGQVETDEIYIGIDKAGTHYVFPVQAKGGTDKLNIVQIEQDFAICKNKFPKLQCSAIGAQFIEDDLIALFLFQEIDSEVRLHSEKHYRLIPTDNFECVK